MRRLTLREVKELYGGKLPPDAVLRPDDNEIAATEAAHPAPVAKMWANSALVFEGGLDALPAGAITWLVAGAVIGVIYTLLEEHPRLKPWMPETIGVGLGLVLSPANGLSFFLGGFVMWIVLGRWLRWSDTTLTTIAVASIVAEGIGGVLQSVIVHLAG